MGQSNQEVAPGVALLSFGTKWLSQLKARVNEPAALRDALHLAAAGEEKRRPVEADAR
jgi:hypothetical protein